MLERIGEEAYPVQRGSRSISCAASVALTFATLLPSPTVDAQAFPSKPIRVIVPFPAGGNADVFARMLGARMSESLAQTIIIDNRAGAAGIIGTQAAMKSAPDGYTLLMGTTGTHATNPAVYRKLPYDPIKDFLPVGNFASSPSVLVVHPSLPARDLKQLIALARARPGMLNYASFGAGSSAHLTGEMLASMAKIRLSHVAYKGGPPALADVAGGHVEMMFNLLPGVLPMVKAGKLRPIAIAAATRTAALPDLPTFEEGGLRDFLSDSWYGIFAPAGTPAPRVKQLNAEINRILSLSDVLQSLESQGADALAGSPEQFARQIRQDLERWSAVARAAGLQLD
jgi:tripartite-type tricarboxylate transporter receptor subunit TctC